MSSTQHVSPTIIYYDGWCKACIKSAQFFDKIDRQRGIVICVDIRSDDPRIAESGIEKMALATSLHTFTPDGSVYAGPEAIRQAMDALGRGPAVSWTRWLVFRPIVDIGYRIFARNRLRWFATHACRDGTCQDGTCSIDPSITPNEPRP